MNKRMASEETKQEVVKRFLSGTPAGQLVKEYHGLFLAQNVGRWATNPKYLPEGAVVQKPAQKVAGLVAQHHFIPKADLGQIIPEGVDPWVIVNGTAKAFASKDEALRAYLLQGGSRLYRCIPVDVEVSVKERSAVVPAEVRDENFTDVPGDTTGLSPQVFEAKPIPQEVLAQKASERMDQMEPSPSLPGVRVRSKKAKAATPTT